MGKKRLEQIKTGWQTFDHIADIGVRGIGKSLEEAFENGAKALFSLMVDDVKKIDLKEKREIKCASFDLVGLFVAWLNNLLAICDIHQEVYGNFDVEITELNLTGMAFGEKWDKKKHGIGIEVKGATFSEAFVKKENGLWIAQCIVDV